MSYLRAILSGDADLMTRAFTVSPTFSTSATDLSWPFVMFDMWSKPLQNITNLWDAKWFMVQVSEEGLLSVLNFWYDKDTSYYY